MLKKSLYALPLIFISCSALSAPVANLKVIGEIAPPTCTINGLSNANIEYVFNVSPNLFPDTGNYELDGISKKIQIICDSTTYLTFNAQDNRENSVNIGGTTNYAFGLGMFDTDKKVGYYIINMKNPTVKASNQSEEKQVGMVANNTYLDDEMIVTKSYTIAWAAAQNQLASGQVFSAEFEVTPYLNADLKKHTGDASLDGHATLTFGFAI